VYVGGRRAGVCAGVTVLVCWGVCVMVLAYLCECADVQVVLELEVELEVALKQLQTKKILELITM
jgi:hypothetical protein